ncbi:MAG: YihY family inner membrane protein [Rubrivivax sp.]|nr:YihY family inner membrane protein [Rubrivivax sp.]
MSTLLDLGGKVGQPVAVLLETLRNWPWYETLRTLYQRFREDRLGLTAGSLTFTTLIALVPLFTVMLAVFTAFPMFASIQADLERYFLNSLVPDNIARPVLSALTEFAGKARGMGAAGLVLLVITALALMMTIDRTLNAIWRVRQRRPFAQRVLVYWAALTLGPVALGLSLSLTSYALSAPRGLVTVLPGGVAFALNALQFLLLAAGMAGLYRYVPNVSVRWRHAWAGGLFVAVAFEGTQEALVWYVASVPTYSAVYGAFATAPILLLWVYLGWVIVLLGAVIAAYAPSLQMRVATIAPTAGWRFELALTVLMRLDAARRSGRHGLSLAAMAESLRADPLQLEPMVELLIELDWVSRLDEGGDARLVLLCDAATTRLAPLVERTLLKPGPASAAFRTRAGLGSMTLGAALAAAPE